MIEPKVSIIVPVYKTEKYLQRCLKTLREQTLQEIEIILVDDGSPDNCPALCDAAAAGDARIRVIHKENGGLGYARNTGMEAAKGKYIGFVDSDDYVSENMFEELYRAAEENEAQLVLSGICFVGGNVFGKDGECTQNVYFDKVTLFETENDIKELTLGIAGALPDEPLDSRYGMSACKNLYSRELAEKNGIRFLSEREILSEDALFMIDYISHTDRAVGIPDVFYFYCRNGESLSKSYRRERFEKSLTFMDELEKRIIMHIPASEYKIYLDRLAQSLGRVLISQEVMHAKQCETGYYGLRSRLRSICTSDRICSALKNYPWYRLPFKQAVFAFLMKYKLYLLQIIVVWLREK